MNAKRWALVALGVGLVALGLDALVRTKAEGYGRPVFHDDDTQPLAEDAAGPFNLGQGLGVCQLCGNLPDTPGHELGCPTGRAQYGQGRADGEVPVDGSWEDLLAFMLGRAAGIPDLTKLQPPTEGTP